MTKLEQIALAIFRKVASDPAAEWADLSTEERDDAIEWARAAVGASGEEQG